METSNSMEAPPEMAVVLHEVCTYYTYIKEGTLALHVLMLRHTVGIYSTCI